MSDPERLNLRSDLGASMLRAARRDVAPGSVRRRAAAAVGLAVGMAASESAASVVAVGATRALVMKVVASVGALALAGVAVVAVVPPRAPSAVSRVASPPAVTVPQEAARPTGQGRLLPPALVAVPPVLAPDPVVTAPARPVVSPVPASGAPEPASGAPEPRGSSLASSPSTPPTLADEVASLARVKQALEGQRAGEALGLIDRFFEDFPHSHLQPEAEALRIEALAATGDRAGALSFLRAFRAAHPDSPLLEHLGSSVGR